MPGQNSAQATDRFVLGTFVLVAVLTWVIGLLLWVGLGWGASNLALVAVIGLILGLLAAVWTGLDPHSN